jgi:hypothetical protein
VRRGREWHARALRAFCIDGDEELVVMTFTPIPPTPNDDSLNLLASWAVLSPDPPAVDPDVATSPRLSP